MSSRTSLTAARVSSASALLLSSLLLVQASPTLAGDVFYSGRATAVSGTVKLGDVVQTVTISDNGMSCQGLPKTETLYNVNHPLPIGVRADEAYTFTQGKDRRAISKARLSNLSLDIPGLALGLTAVESRAEANCDESNVVKVIGKSTFGSLSVNGQSYAITGQPNQTIQIPNVASITVNEQTKFSTEMRVVGLRIKLLNASQPLYGDIQVAAARAKISCS